MFSPWFLRREKVRVLVFIKFNLLACFAKCVVHFFFDGQNLTTVTDASRDRHVTVTCPSRPIINYNYQLSNHSLL